MLNFQKTFFLSSHLCNNNLTYFRFFWTTVDTANDRCKVYGGGQSGNVARLRGRRVSLGVWPSTKSKSPPAVRIGFGAVRRVGRKSTALRSLRPPTGVLQTDKHNDTHIYVYVYTPTIVNDI